MKFWEVLSSTAGAYETLSCDGQGVAPDCTAFPFPAGYWLEAPSELGCLSKTVFDLPVHAPFSSASPAMLMVIGPASGKVSGLRSTRQLQ